MSEAGAGRKGVNQTEKVKRQGKKGGRGRGGGGEREIERGERERGEREREER